MRMVRNMSIHAANMSVHDARALADHSEAVAAAEHVTGFTVIPIPLEEMVLLAQRVPMMGSIPTAAQSMCAQLFQRILQNIADHEGHCNE